MIPGIASQPSEFADGMKVNTISELTSTNGVQHMGRTSGVAIEAGKVGQVVACSTLATQAMTGTITDWAGATITLGAGVWLIVANISASATANSGAGYYATTWAQITDSANNMINNQLKSISVSAATATTPGLYGILSFSTVVYPTSATTYKIRGQRTGDGGGLNGTLWHQVLYYSEFFAVRIA